MIDGVVFDGDDTLWRTEALYDDARQQARAVVEAAGLNGTAWEDLERRIDVDSVRRLGHSPDRFPSSCVRAYQKVCSLAAEAAESEVSAAIDAAARTAFQAKAMLLPDAREILTDLRRRGLRLALLTKGDQVVQTRRIHDSGLAPLFHVVRIVEDKTESAIRGAVRRLGVETRAACSVGNSIRSDVLPSLLAGVRPVWLEGYVWEYERAHDDLAPEGLTHIMNLAELLAVLD